MDDRHSVVVELAWNEEEGNYQVHLTAAPSIDLHLVANLEKNRSNDAEYSLKDRAHADMFWKILEAVPGYYDENTLATS